MRTKFFLFSILLFSYFSNEFVWGEDSLIDNKISFSSTESSKFVKDVLFPALKSQINSQNPIFVRYILHEVQNQPIIGNETRSSQPESNALSPSYSTTPKGTVAHIVEYAQKGDRLYCMYKSDQTDTYAEITVVNKYGVIGTEEQKTEDGRPIFRTSSDPKNFRKRFDPLSVSGNSIFFNDLELYTTDPEVSSIDVEVLKWKSEDNNFYEVLLHFPIMIIKVTLYSDGKFFHIEKYERLDVKSKVPLLVCQDISYSCEDDLCYPNKAVCRIFNGKEIFLEQTVEVISVSNKKSQIPDTLFELKIPANAAIRDLDSLTLLESPEMIQQHLERMKIVRPKFGFGRLAVMLFVNVLIISYITYRVVKRKREMA